MLQPIGGEIESAQISRPDRASVQSNLRKAAQFRGVVGQVADSWKNYRLVDVRDGAEYALRFAAGLFGVGQEADGALVPEFGWAVLYEN